MSAVLQAVLAAVLTAFAEAFSDWLKDRQANADAKSVGTLTEQLAGANAEIELQRQDKAIVAASATLTDDEARAEALKWSR